MDNGPVQKTRVYLAGPMRGMPAYNFPAFDAAAAELRASGYVVFNPAEQDRSDGFTPAVEDTDGVHPHNLAHYMAIDLAEVCKADLVVVLDGWEQSQGATLEVHVAWECGIEVRRYTGWDLVRKDVTITGPLPTDSEERKTYPLYRGLFRYFPRALAAIAHHSHENNEKHNPGEPLHWAREKSRDHEDALLRHVMDGDWHGAAWRALAKLELVLEGDA